MPEMKRRVPMFLLTGFLGSGKTTLLNRLIHLLPGSRLAVIVNDFGDLPVDGAFLDRGENVMKVTELNGGQIFCSCLSGSFVESVAAYQDLEVDLLFIECSGLAKPTPMMEIMEQVMSASGGAFDYAGMICLIDAESYEDLADVVNAVDEQLFFSDCFIINKVDLVDAETLERIRRRIAIYHPQAPVYETSFAQVEASVLDFRRGDVPSDGEQAAWSGWGERGRPYTFSFRSDGVLKEDAVRRFLEELSPHTYRIKGLLAVGEGLRQIDCTGRDVQIRPYAERENGMRGGVVLISRIGEAVKPLADAAWLKCLSAS